MRRKWLFYLLFLLSIKCNAQSAEKCFFAIQIGVINYNPSTSSFKQMMLEPNFSFAMYKPKCLINDNSRIHFGVKVDYARYNAWRLSYSYIGSAYNVYQLDTSYKLVNMYSLQIPMEYRYAIDKGSKQLFLNSAVFPFFSKHKINEYYSSIDDSSFFSFGVGAGLGLGFVDKQGKTAYSLMFHVLFVHNPNTHFSFYFDKMYTIGFRFDIGLGKKRMRKKDN